MRFALVFVLTLIACGPSTKPAPDQPAGSGSAVQTPGSGSAAPEQPGNADCFCTMQYDPVCGTNGKTYGNACQAGCEKVEVASNGECPK